MLARFLAAILIAMVMALPLRAAPTDGGTGAPTTAPPTSTKPIDDPVRAVTVYNAQWDEPYGRGPSIGIGGGGLGYNTVQAQGAAWWANNTTDTLRDVKLIVHFWSRRFYRTSGSETYNIGTMDPRQSKSLIFRSWIIPAERVVPYFEMVYRKEGDDRLYRTYSWPYGR